MARNRVRSWDETSFYMQAQARSAPQHIIDNTNLAFVKDITGQELDKRVLISLVKPDNVEHYIDHSA